MLHNHTLIVLLLFLFSLKTYAEHFSSVNNMWKIGPTWRTGAIGCSYESPYPFEIVAGDIDNDGQAEIVGSGYIPRGSPTDYKGASFLYLAKLIEGEKDYKIIWVSNHHPGKIVALNALYHQNKLTKIITGMGDGSITVYSGYPPDVVFHSTSSTCSAQPSPAFLACAVKKIITGDADNDNKDEIIVLDTASIRLYDSEKYALKMTIPYGASDIALGNTDSDSLNELVLQNGLVIECSDTSFQFDWNYIRNGFGREIELADVDSDGKDEIISTTGYDSITCYDADLFSFKWSFPTGNIQQLKSCDLEHDGKKELLFIEFGQLQCLNLQDRTLEWINPHHWADVASFTSYDIDSDGKDELIEYIEDPNKDTLGVWRIPKNGFSCSPCTLSAPISKVEFGIIPTSAPIFNKTVKNRRLEFLIGGDNGFWSVTFKNSTPIPRQLYHPCDSAMNCFTNRIECLAFSNEQSGTATIVLKAAENNFVEYDPDSFIVKQSFTPPVVVNAAFGYKFHCMKTGDIDNDGQIEIVIGGGICDRVYTCSSSDPHAIVYIYDLPHAQYEWESPNLAMTMAQDIYDICIGNIDSDSSKEIIVANKELFILDVASQEMQNHMTSDTVYGLSVVDINNNGTDYIIAGTQNGTIAVIEGETLNKICEVQVSDTAVEGIKPFDFNKDGRPEIIFATKGHLGIFDFDDSSVVWRSEQLGIMAGAQSKIIAGDFDSNGKDEIVTTTLHMICAFEVENYAKAGNNSASIPVKKLKTGITCIRKQFLLSVEHFRYLSNCCEIYNLQGRKLNRPGKNHPGHFSNGMVLLKQGINQ